MKVTLEAKTRKGKNRLIEAAKQLPETWDFVWEVFDQRDTIAARDGQGPWLLLIPAGVPPFIGQRFSRWVHCQNDADFAVQVRSNWLWWGNQDTVRLKQQWLDKSSQSTTVGVSAVSCFEVDAQLVSADTKFRQYEERGGRLIG